MKKNVNRQIKQMDRPKPGVPVNKDKKNLFWLPVVLILTFAAFYPSLQNGFVNWDDKEYILENPFIKHLSFENIKIFFSGFFLGNYHPLTMLSFAVDYKTGGLDPLVYHVSNLVFHMVTTVMLYFLAKLLTCRSDASILIAALFGVHTLHVESVAWIAERKDVLYALFFIASLLSYVKYVKTGSLKYYFTALGLFCFSLLSKGQAVSLAVSLLLTDFFLGRRLKDKKLILEKIPFFALAFIFGLIAIRAQEGAFITIPVHERFFYAASGYVLYFLKLVYPYKLAAYYPYPFGGITGSNIAEFLSWVLFALVIMASLVYAYIKKYNLLFFGLAFYSINIFLVLQLLPVGNAIMADRYAYIPSVGIFFAAGFLYLKLSGLKKFSVFIKYGFAGYVVLLSVMTYQRCHVWGSALKLWDDAVTKYPGSHIALMHRGSARNDARDFKGGIEDFNKAIAVFPEYSYAYSYRGAARAGLGDLKGALEDYDKAIKFLPDKYGYYSGRGIVRAQLGDVPGAMEDFDKALELNNLAADVLSNRGIAKAMKGDTGGAMQDFDRAISINPDFSGAYINRGRVHIMLGNKKQACEDFFMSEKCGTKDAQALIKQFCEQ